MRILSGVQPSGKLHLGNFFGAMKQHIEAQEREECFIFIANYHALTTIQDAERLRGLTRDVALDYLALGLDPNKACLFRQSDVPEVTELAWILSTVTGKGLLERAVSFKDKTAKGLSASMGLFCYPILQAADILIYHSDVVPVGKDQVQHIEMTADMAGYFNNTYKCEVFKLPQARLNEAAIVPGVDGEKMSKSYGNTLDLFDDAKSAKKKIMSIKTDSTPVEEPKDPTTCNLFALLKLFASKDEIAEWDARYRKGGMGYGDAKKRLAEFFEEKFGPARERRATLEKDPSYVEDVLASGGKKARDEAQRVMATVRDACGIITRLQSQFVRSAPHSEEQCRKKMSLAEIILGIVNQTAQELTANDIFSRLESQAAEVKSISKKALQSELRKLTRSGLIGRTKQGRECYWHRLTTNQNSCG